MRVDRRRVAAIVTSDQGARGELTQTMEVLDVASDRTVAEFPLVGPSRPGRKAPGGGEAAAKALLQNDRWVRLSRMQVGEDPEAPAHPTDPAALGAPSRANMASAGPVVITYREPLVTIKVDSKTVVEHGVASWSAKPVRSECPRPWGSIGEAWADLDAGVALVYVEYHGFESDICSMADTAIHVVTWKP
jgi:hypothetical protein